MSSKKDSEFNNSVGAPAFDVIPSHPFVDSVVVTESETRLKIQQFRGDRLPGLTLNQLNTLSGGRSPVRYEESSEVIFVHCKAQRERFKVAAEAEWERIRMEDITSTTAELNAIRGAAVLAAVNIKINGRKAALDDTTLLPLCPGCGAPLVDSMKLLETTMKAAEDFGAYSVKNRGSLFCKTCQEVYQFQYSLDIQAGERIDEPEQ